jgi:hypothetical protein
VVALEPPRPPTPLADPPVASKPPEPLAGPLPVVAPVPVLPVPVSGLPWFEVEPPQPASTVAKQIVDSAP